MRNHIGQQDILPAGDILHEFERAAYPPPIDIGKRDDAQIRNGYKFRDPIIFRPTVKSDCFLQIMFLYNFKYFIPGVIVAAPSQYKHLYIAFTGFNYSDWVNKLD